jgi:hypothetical protein
LVKKFKILLLNKQHDDYKKPKRSVVKNNATVGTCVTSTRICCYVRRKYTKCTKSIDTNSVTGGRFSSSTGHHYFRID